jgi:Rrf2 family protein
MSTNTQFALGVHMLTLLASAAPESLSSDQLAGSANASPVHVRRVLGRFREAGLVGSKPGVGGGSHLVEHPATITLADVWRVIHGDAPFLGTYEGRPDCLVGSHIQQMLLDIDREARRALETQLARTTIADLVTRAGVLAGLPAPAEPVGASRPG